MKKLSKHTVALLLSLVLLLSAMPLGAGADFSFPDVPEGAWYETYLNKIIWAQQTMGQMNIITGYEDGTFRPEREVTRGEWLKMLFEALESSGGQTTFLTPGTLQAGDHWARQYYLKAKADNILVADVYTSTQPMFTDSHDDLNTPMNRYEMAVVLNNVCINLAMQKTVVTKTPEAHITDYALIPESYRTAVEQMYGKGLLTGYEDGSFVGEGTLTRAQAATVLYRFLFVDTIQGEGLQSWAEYPVVTQTSNYLDPSLSFANWLKQGHVDAYGNIDAEARLRLFGSSTKGYFSSSREAAPYMVTISVPIWVVDKSGIKTSSTCPVTVHYLVAEEVQSIFQMIYDDPEQFPIYGGWSVGGARYTDHLRHSWGCAIDVNAYYNCECNTQKGYLTVTCGYGWWPMGHSESFFAGSITANSANRQYSIGKYPGEYGYSVKRAFETYGWGWGGNGWNSGTRFDYMHFSILPSGG